MTLDLFDLLWNIPLLFITFGGLWMTFKTKHDPNVMWPWHAASAFVWYVNAITETLQGDTLWMWISTILGSLGVVNFFSGYHQAQRAEDVKREREDAKREVFEAFRIDK